MGKLDTFKIDLKGLSTENACFEFSLDKAYFDAIGSEDLKGGDLHTTLQVRKVAGNFELSFHTEGVVTVTCDLCLDDMSLPIATDNKLVAMSSTTATNTLSFPPTRASSMWPG